MIGNRNRIQRFKQEVGTYSVNQYALALFMEVAELVESFNWKPWKDMEVDRENLKREIVDVMFFLSHIADAYEITNEELNEKFDEVMINNERRYM